MAPVFALSIAAYVLAGMADQISVVMRSTATRPIAAGSWSITVTPGEDVTKGGLFFFDAAFCLNSSSPGTTTCLVNTRALPSAPNA